MSITDRVKDALVSAEAQLFAHLGLDAESRILQLRDAPVETARVLLVAPTGSGGGTSQVPILFVHGAGTMASMWAPLLAAMPGRQLLAVDLPGCGLSGRYRFDPSDDLRAHAIGFLEAVLSALGIDRVVVAGSSLGGMYALHYASSRPERVEALVLLGDPAVALPVTGSNTYAGLASAAAGCRLLSRFGGRPLGPGAAKRFIAAIGGTRAVVRQPKLLWAALSPALRLSSRVTASLFAPLLRACRDPEHHGVSGDDLSGVDVPTLLVWGEDDLFQRAEDGARAARRIPRARFELVEGGHLPWLDDTAGCADRITRFLEDLPPRRATQREADRR